MATVETTSSDAWTWVAAAVASSGYCLYKAYELMAGPGVAGIVFGLLFLVVPVWLVEVAAMRVGGRVDVVKEEEGRFFCQDRAAGLDVPVPVEGGAGSAAFGDAGAEEAGGEKGYMGRFGRWEGGVVWVAVGERGARLFD